jgi:protoporphyrinogen oxidase
LKGSFFDFPLKISQIAAKMPFTAFNSGIEMLTKSINKLPDDSYENFLINRFGRTLYNLSFRDYAHKVWQSNPLELDRELAKRRVAVSGIFELIKSVLLKDSKKISAEYFYYPEKGMSQLLDSLVAKIKENGGKILLNTEISEIFIKNSKIKYIRFKSLKIKTDYIISTIPLDALLNLIKPDVTLETPSLNYQKLNLIYFILNKERALKDCWIFFPEKKFIFQRVSEQKAFSEKTCPQNKTAIIVETTQDIDENLINEVISQLENIEVLKKEEIEEYFVKSIPKAYPIYKKGFLEGFKKVEGFFNSVEGFYLLGRQGLFNYNNIDQCWDMALKIAEQIKENKTKEDWARTKEYFKTYRIVD